MEPSDPQEQFSLPEAIARTWSADFSLSISREDTAFLTGIHTWIQLYSDTVFGEEPLRDIFFIVNEIANNDSVSLASRTTRAIGRLREQNLLARTDTAGILSREVSTLSPCLEEPWPSGLPPRKA